MTGSKVNNGGEMPAGLLERFRAGHLQQWEAGRLWPIENGPTHKFEVLGR